MTVIQVAVSLKHCVQCLTPDAHPPYRFFVRCTRWQPSLVGAPGFSSLKSVQPGEAALRNSRLHPRTSFEGLRCKFVICSPAAFTLNSLLDSAYRSHIRPGDTAHRNSRSLTISVASRYILSCGFYLRESTASEKCTCGVAKPTVTSRDAGPEYRGYRQRVALQLTSQCR